MGEWEGYSEAEKSWNYKQTEKPDGETLEIGVKIEIIRSLLVWWNHEKVEQGLIGKLRYNHKNFSTLHGSNSFIWNFLNNSSSP